MCCVYVSNERRAGMAQMAANANQPHTRVKQIFMMSLLLECVTGIPHPDFLEVHESGTIPSALSASRWLYVRPSRTMLNPAPLFAAHIHQPYLTSCSPVANVSPPSLTTSTFQIPAQTIV